MSGTAEGSRTSFVVGGARIGGRQYTATPGRFGAGEIGAGARDVRRVTNRMKILGLRAHE